MKRFPLSAFVAALAGAAVAQSAPTLYVPGRSVADQGIRLRPWGSGLATETEELAFEGATSIRIGSRNFFQGGSLVFQEPVSLAAAFADRSNLLRIVFRTVDTPTAGGPGMGAGIGGGKGGGAAGPGGLAGPGGSPGGAAGGAPGGRGQGGRGGGLGGPGGGFGPGGPGGGFGPGSPGGQGGFGSPGKGGGLGMGGGASAGPTPLRTVRLVIATTDGLRSEAYVTVGSSTSAPNGWRQAGVPLQAIKGFERTNKTIREITVAGDSTAAFFIGDLRVIADPTPIRAEITGPLSLNLAQNDVVTLSASGSGGSSVLRYAWDFDDSDGVGTDAEGRTITHRFRKPGTFTVTLTVSDEYGLKEPYTTTMKVKVNG